jgi:hypothetical protein
MPFDGSARTTSPISPASASPSKPVPAPTSITRIAEVSGTFARIVSATAFARSRRSGVSQSRRARQRSSPAQGHTPWPVGG